MSPTVVETARLSSYNLDQLVRQAHACWQSLSVTAGSVREGQDLPVDDLRSIDAKMEVVQTLCHLLRRSAGELDDLIFESKARSEGSEVAALTDHRLGQIEDALRRPEREVSRAEIERACFELLKEVKQHPDRQPFTGHDLNEVCPGPDDTRAFDPGRAAFE